MFVCMRDGTKCQSHCNKSFHTKKWNFSPSLFIIFSIPLSITQMHIHSLSFSLSLLPTLSIYHLSVCVHKCVRYYCIQQSLLKSYPMQFRMCVFWHELFCWSYVCVNMFQRYMKFEICIELKPEMHFELYFRMNFFFYLMCCIMKITFKFKLVLLNSVSISVFIFFPFFIFSFVLLYNSFSFFFLVKW